MDRVSEVLRLKREGMKFSKIAAELGITIGAARGIWQRHRTAGDAGRDWASLLAANPSNAEQLLPTKEMPRKVELDGNEGYITTGPVTESSPDFEALLQHFGFDPDQFEILEPVNVRTWDAAIGNGVVRRMWYHKANIRRRRSGLYLADVNDLIESIRSRAPVSPYRGPTGDEAFVFAPADLQLGKSDGDGTKGTVQRFRDKLAAAQWRMEELRATGRRIGEVLLLHMGDGNENTDGHYAMQAFSVELNRRDQIKLLRELLWEAIEAFSGQAPSLHVAGVAGNHPENRKDGKAYTSFGDNDDLAVLDQLQMVAETTGLENVRFTIPKDELELLLDVCGTKIGVAHGHQMRGGGSSIEARVKKWWEDQMLGRRPIGEADLLITAHNHHAIFKALNGRWWFQCPALESRSDWVRNTIGDPGSPGILTFTTAGGSWRDLQVL